MVAACAASAQGKATLLDPDLFRSKHFRFGVTGQLLQQIALGGTMIVLPIFLQMVLEYNAMQAGLSLAPLSFSMFAVALIAGKRAGKAASGQHHPARFRAGRSSGCVLLIPLVPRANSGWYLVVPLIIVGPGSVCWSPSSTTTRCRPSPRSESARRPASTRQQVLSDCRSGWPSPARSCWRRCRSPSPRWRTTARCSAPTEQQQVATALEDDAELMSNTQLEEQLVGQPADVQAEIIRINTDARPLALQVALLIPILAGFGGLFNSFRMMRLPDPEPSSDLDGVTLA